MELYDWESARELPERLRHRRDPGRSFAGVPVGEGISCYLLSGNLDKLKLFFCVLQIILNVFLIWGKVNKLREFSNSALFAHTQLQGSAGGFVRAREGKPMDPGNPFFCHSTLFASRGHESFLIINFLLILLVEFYCCCILQRKKPQGCVLYIYSLWFRGEQIHSLSPRILGSLGLEKSSKIIKSTCQPSSTTLL